MSRVCEAAAKRRFHPCPPPNTVAVTPLKLPRAAVRVQLEPLRTYGEPAAHGPPASFVMRRASVPYTWMYIGARATCPSELVAVNVTTRVAVSPNAAGQLNRPLPSPRSVKTAF